MNTYFKLSPKDKRHFWICLIGWAVAINVLVGISLFLISPSLLYFMFFSFSVTISILAPFIDVPSLVKSGRLKYLSLFLLAEKEKSGAIKIHGGTLFDYYFTLDPEQSEQKRKEFILLEQIKGIKRLLGSTNDEVIVEGTSYFLNRRTAEKIGFQVVRTDLLQKAILIYNYVNLMCSLYLVKRVLTFPSISEVKTFQASILDIKKNVEFIDTITRKLESRQ